MPTEAQVLRASLAALFAERRKVQGLIDRVGGSQRRYTNYALRARMFRERREIDERIRLARARLDALDAGAA